MRTLIAGEGGSVLVAGATSTDAAALACEGLAASTQVPSGLPVYPADALPDDLVVDVVELLPCEAITGDVVRAWARAHDVTVHQIETLRIPTPADVRVVAVSALSTGSGKTALTRRVARHMRGAGVRTAVARHPIANLLSWNRFAPSVVRTPPELLEGRPLEEREELAPLVGAGIPCVTGLDPHGIVQAAAREGDVIVLDGGGASAPWIAPDLHIVAVDLLRGLTHDRAGERLRAADAIVLTKADTAPPDRARAVEAQVRALAPEAAVLLADLTVGVQDGPALMDRRAVVVEDWASLALGGLGGGAGAVAARRFRCGVVDPRPFAIGAVRVALGALPQLDGVIPSIGRTPSEIEDLAESVRQTPGDVVLWASNADPAGVLMSETRRVIRAYGELAEVAGPSLAEVLAPLL